MKKTLILALLLFTEFSAAATFTVTASDPKTQIPEKAKLDDVELKKMSTGIRKKKFLLMNWDVYQATLLVSDATKFVKDTADTKALDSLLSMPGFALELRLLREVKADDLVNGFEDALKKNGATSPALQTLKAELRSSGTMPQGHVVTLAVNTATKKLLCKHGTKSIELPDADGKLARDVFSIWLGKSADNLLETLRKQLILTK